MPPSGFRTARGVARGLSRSKNWIRGSLACVARHARALAQRNTPWDIVVIGGGATGVGIAVDAASRGYDVVLLEQHDFGKGTSSRSTKLVHGGASNRATSRW